MSANHFERMRASLTPRGSAQVKWLGLKNPHVDLDLIATAIDDLEKAVIRHASGLGPITALERLGAKLLCEGLGIDLES